MKRIVLGVSISGSGMFMQGKPEYKHLGESSDLSSDTVLKRTCNNTGEFWFPDRMVSACDEVDKAFSKLDDILIEYKNRKSVDQAQKSQLQKEIEALKQNTTLSGTYIFMCESQDTRNKELKYVQEYVEKRHPGKDIKDVLQRVLNSE